MGSTDKPTRLDADDELPVKTRELSNHHMDSTVWNELERRPDDIIIATHAKSGTTVRPRSHTPPCRGDDMPSPLPDTTTC